MKVIVSNIQRFCLHDGPGIRTTVFFKGCNLKCPWCNNPENISFKIERYKKDNNEGEYGKEYTLEELYNEIIKDKDFFENNGGVTFSGGECLWQFEKIEPLLKRIKDEGISICIETALNVPQKYIDIALKYVDFFYIDMKIIDKNKQYLINSDEELYLTNLDKIMTNTNRIIIRIPIVPEFTYTEENINGIIDILKNRKIKTIEIFKIHYLAEDKYKSLGKEMKLFNDISEDEMLKLKKRLQEFVENVNIINI